MTNIYWPVYKNLESELGKLMFNIHIDDNQLNVYSSKISDLILRASIEIESLAKALYLANGGKSKKYISYDYDAIEFLDSLWDLKSKVVIISTPNSFQTQRILCPFKKNENGTNNNKLTFSWNNAYQNLKHDRANSLQFGSVKYLFEIMSALFVLNIYFKDESYNLEKDSNATNFVSNLGSEIFSVKIHKDPGINAAGAFRKYKDYEECVYLLKPTKETAEVVIEFLKSLNKHQGTKLQHIINQVNAKFPDYKDLNPNELEGFVKQESSNFDSDILIKEAKRNPREIASKFDQLRYEAILNKNQF